MGTHGTRPSMQAPNSSPPVARILGSMCRPTCCMASWRPRAPKVLILEPARRLRMPPFSCACHGHQLNPSHPLAWHAAADTSKPRLDKRRIFLSVHKQAEDLQPASSVIRCGICLDYPTLHRLARLPRPLTHHTLLPVTFPPRRVNVAYVRPGTEPPPASVADFWFDQVRVGDALRMPYGLGATLLSPPSVPTPVELHHPAAALVDTVAARAHTARSFTRSASSA